MAVLRHGRRRGGILGLYRLLIEHGEAVEADLSLRGVRLSELGRTLSWRYLSSLVRNLPRDSATLCSIEGPASTVNISDHLLAGAVFQLQNLVWQGGGGKGIKPRPIDLSAKPRNRSTLSDLEMARRLKALRTRKG